jgi:polyvinyl alcohol dehydrogenase (cytochrome)
VHAINPATGKLIWKTKVGRGSLLGGINFGMAVANDMVFVPIADVKDGTGETPAGIFIGARHPGLHALNINTGEISWRSPMVNSCEGKDSCLPGIAQAIAASDQLVFTGGMDGVLRIYDTASGKVLWQYQTAKSFTGSNGVEGMGGSFAGGSGPVVHGNMLFASSGYAFNGLMPGNVLLAFELQPESDRLQK